MTADDIDLRALRVDMEERAERGDGVSPLSPATIAKVTARALAAEERLAQVTSIGQTELDLIADIIWWIKGALSTGGGECAFGPGHAEALRKARFALSRIKESP